MNSAILPYKILFFFQDLYFQIYELVKSPRATCHSVANYTFKYVFLKAKKNEIAKINSFTWFCTPIANY